jgi:hypothetical protein
MSRARFTLKSVPWCTTLMLQYAMSCNDVLGVDCGVEL